MDVRVANGAGELRIELVVSSPRCRTASLPTSTALTPCIDIEPLARSRPRRSASPTTRQRSGTVRRCPARRGQPPRRQHEQEGERPEPGDLHPGHVDAEDPVVDERDEQCKQRRQLKDVAAFVERALAEDELVAVVEADELADQDDQRRKSRGAEAELRRSRRARRLRLQARRASRRRRQRPAAAGSCCRGEGSPACPGRRTARRAATERQSARSHGACGCGRRSARERGPAVSGHVRGREPLLRTELASRTGYCAKLLSGSQRKPDPYQSGFKRSYRDIHNHENRGSSTDRVHKLRQPLWAQGPMGERIARLPARGRNGARSSRFRRFGVQTWTASCGQSGESGSWLVSGARSRRSRRP